MNLELNLFEGEASADLSADAVPSDAAYAQPQETSDTEKESAFNKDAEFQNLIKGEFKEQFEQRIKDNLNRRFKESSSLKAKISQSEEIMDLLKSKYGIADGSMAEIADAIRNDEGFNAREKSETQTDAFTKIRELETENESIKNQIARGLEERKLNKTVNSWINDAKELKESYPDFDLRTEAKNPSFLKMLRSGVDLKNAYYAAHHDEIVQSMVEKAAREASLKITDSIRARGVRANENGISNQSSAVFKTDVSKLTPKERDLIARRAMKGEKISF